MTTKLEAGVNEVRRLADQFRELNATAKRLREQRDHLDRERKAVVAQMDQLSEKLLAARHDFWVESLGGEVEVEAGDERWAR